MGRSSCMRRNDGFTLLEVMIALAVLAIALAAVIDKSIEAGANVSYLRDRTLAHWVAENRLAEMQAMEDWRDGRQTGEAELADRAWYWEVEALPTPARNLRRVVIRVSDQEDAETPLSVLHGFLLNPQVRKPVATVAQNPPGDDGNEPPDGESNTPGTGAGEPGNG